jgi:hypothetical protein
MMLKEWLLSHKMDLSKSLFLKINEIQALKIICLTIFHRKYDIIQLIFIQMDRRQYPFSPSKDLEKST